MNKDNLDAVVNELKNRDNFLITAHVNPEGDSIGSQLAFYYILQHLNKNVIMVDHDPVPVNLKFLTGSELIRSEVPEFFDVRTVVILDCPVKERAGRIHKYFDNADLTINIDHHISNEKFGDVNWVEADASSVGEMAFELIKHLGIKIDRNMASAIYTSIVTDTGLFTYDNTSERTHQIAGALISSGINPKKLHAEIFEKKSLPYVRLLGRALSTIYLEGDGKIACMSLTRDMYKAEGVKSVPTDEFINMPRSVSGVEVVTFFKENSEDATKVNVSFRSRGNVDVNLIAGEFGGGGHEQAAGCLLVDCTMEEAQKKVIERIKEEIFEEGVDPAGN